MSCSRVEAEKIISKYNYFFYKESWQKSNIAVFFHSGKRIGDEINENEFVKMLSKKIQGKVTLTSDELDNASASYKSAGVVTKVRSKNKNNII